jgi:transcriptional regulator with XRE-family HTH domain
MGKTTEISRKFGENIRKIRMQKGISQEELAHLANFHRTYIGTIERAEKNITLVNMEKIAQALGKSIVELLTFDNE